jgi:hypothetical protein
MYERAASRPVSRHVCFALVGSVSASIKIFNESDIAQTIIVGIRYCPNMNKYLVLVLFMLFTAAAFAQPYYHHHHVIVIRHRRHHYYHHYHHEHAQVAVR